MIERDAASGELRRYLQLRADTLMGLFRHLPEGLRTQAFAALARSTAEHGGDSARRYLAGGAGDAAAPLARIEASAVELGWGSWRFGERSAPITGMLAVVAGLLLGAACEAREVECRARGAARCRFEALLRSVSSGRARPLAGRNRRSPLTVHGSPLACLLMSEITSSRSSPSFFRVGVTSSQSMISHW